MQVREAMAETIAVVAPDDTLVKVAQLMREEDAGFIPVCKNDELLGVVTDRDIVIRCIAEGHNVLNEAAEHCMTKAPVVVEASATLEEAGRLMAQNEVRRLPVLEGGR